MDSEEQKVSEAEEKYKFILLQVDKRLVNLELEMGEINEKINSLKAVDETIKAINERLDELEDLIMVENLGEMELRKLLQNVNFLTTDVSQKTIDLSKRIKNFEALAPQLEEEIKKLASRLEPLETSVIKKLEDEVLSLKDESTKLASKEDLNILKKNVEKLNEKIAKILIPIDRIFNITDKFLILEEKIKLLEKIKEDLIPIKNEINILKKRTEFLEKSLPTENIAKIEDELAKLKEVFSQVVLRQEVEEKIKAIGEEIGKVDEIKNKLISLEEGVNELRGNLSLIEDSVMKKFDEKISILPLQSQEVLRFGEEFSKLKEDVSNLETKTQQIANLENEIERLSERIKPLETQVIQRLASEISDIRAETSKEIKEIKDKISGIITTKSEIDIKFLSSRFNSLKENVDYLLNRKAEFDIKIDSIQKGLIKLAENLEELANRPAIPPSVEERIENLEERIETLWKKVFENSRIGVYQLPGDKTERKEEVSKKSDNEAEIKKLTEKISLLEDKLMSLEEGAKNRKPFIVE